MPDPTRGTIGSTFNAFLEGEGIAEQVNKLARKKIATATTPAAPGPDIPPETSAADRSTDPTAA